MSPRAATTGEGRGQPRVITRGLQPRRRSCRSTPARTGQLCCLFAESRPLPSQCPFRESPQHSTLTEGEPARVQSSGYQRNCRERTPSHHPHTYTPTIHTTHILHNTHITHTLHNTQVTHTYTLTHSSTIHTTHTHTLRNTQVTNEHIHSLTYLLYIHTHSTQYSPHTHSTQHTHHTHTHTLHNTQVTHKYTVTHSPTIHTTHTHTHTLYIIHMSQTNTYTLTNSPTIHTTHTHSTQYTCHKHTLIIHIHNTHTLSPWDGWCRSFYQKSLKLNFSMSLSLYIYIFFFCFLFYIGV